MLVWKRLCATLKRDVCYFEEGRVLSVEDVVCYFEEGLWYFEEWRGWLVVDGCLVL